MKPTHLLLPIACAGGVLLLSPQVRAATYYWDGGSVDIGTNGNGASGGTLGTWDTTILNWDVGASPHVAWDNSGNHTAVFAGTAGAVTLGSNVTVGGLTFNTAGYSIAPGAGPYAITFGVPGNINVSTGTTTISAAINGSAITKTGGGTLALSGTNTYTGGTTISGGQLNITSDANLGNSDGDLTFTGNATLRMDATGFVMNAGRTITINSGVTATFSSNNNGKTFAGVLQGDGAIIGADSTGYIFTNLNNTFTGTVNNGYQMVFYSIGDSSNTFNLVGSNSEFQWAGGEKNFALRSLTLNATGTGNFNNNGTGAVTFVQNLAFSGGAGARTVSFGGSNTDLNTFSGNIANYGASVVSVSKNGAGIWALGGTNTYTGDTNLLASGTTGVLIFQGSQALSANTTLKFAQSSSNVQSVRFLDDGAGTINFNRPIEFGGTNTSQNLNILVGNNHIANGGSSSGTTTGSTIQVGNITFTSVNTDTNTTTINATSPNGYRLQTGTITLNNLVTRTAGQTTVTALNPTTANMTVAAITMATGNTGIANDGVPVLRLTGTSMDNYVTGAISNASDYLTGQALSLQKQGTSTWTLQGTNTYTGTTTISAGKLLLSSTGSLDAGSAVTVSGGAIGGTGTVNGTLALSSTGGIDLRDGAVGQFNINNTLSSTGAAGANNLYFDLASGGSTTDKIAATGAFSMTTAGAAVINLNQLGGTTNRLTAGTYDILTAASGINASDFTLATTNAFGQTFALSNPDGTKLQLITTQVSASAGNVTLSGTNPSWTVAGNFTGSVLPDYESNVTINSAIGTTGTLSASQNINSLNYGTSATTNTTITPGTAAAGTAYNMLVIEAAGVNGNTAGNGITLSNTSGTHTISANIGITRSQIWNIAGTTGGLTVSGAISDFGAGYGLTKAGSGTLTLTGTNTFSGPLVMNGGTLALGGSLVGLGSPSSVTFTGNSTISTTASGFTLTLPALQINPGVTAVFDKGSAGGGGTFTFNGALTGSGTLSFASGGSGNGTFNLNDAGAFTGTVQTSSYTTNGSTNLNFTGLGDGGKISHGGTGIDLTVNYTGSTDLTFNTRQFEMASAASTRGIRINNNATFDADLTINTALSVTATGTKALTLGGTSGGVSTFGGNIVDGSGTIGVTKADTNTWALTSANNTFTGAITLSSTTTSAGTLSYASAGGANTITFSQTTGSAALSYTGSGQTMSGAITATALTTGTITLDASGTGAVNYSNSGSLGSAASGNKNLVLSGTNTGNNILAGAWVNNTGGAATLTKSGAGKWILSGTNTYTGATSVNAGTLAINGSITSAVTVASGATLQGSGTISSSVTINGGGILAAGNSIESLATGDLAMAAAAIFAYEADNNAASGVAGDLTAVTGNLSIANTTTILTLSELGAGSWTAGEKLTLIAYSGTWNNGLFSYNSSTLADGATITFSGIDWTFDYNDASAGTNYTGDLTGMTSYVTMTAIPEPGVAMLGGLSLLGLLLRRRRS